MADYPPFMNAYGTCAKILEKMKQAATPERFTQDFLATKLGFPGGTPKAFIPLAKRLGLISSDGTPTELYKKFRGTPNQSKVAMAEAIRKGYPELYARNEYAHDLDSKGLDGLVTEITGLPQGHGTIKAITGTFKTLRGFADFEAKDTRKESASDEQTQIEEIEDKDGEIKVGLSYTINLVLPKTDDIAVFTAIFKSLRENLLRK